jgi:hypothetical protein
VIFWEGDILKFLLGSVLKIWATDCHKLEVEFQCAILRLLCSDCMMSESKVAAIFVVEICKKLVLILLALLQKLIKLLLR